MSTITKEEFSQDPKAVMTRAERDDVTITDGDGTPIMVLMTQREALPNPERDAERERWRAAVRALLDAMPRCPACQDIGTLTTYDGAWCAKHVPASRLWPPRDLLYAAPLRALQAMVEEEDTPRAP